ncbi:MAG: formimidoylglutamate deiminase [Actinomycetota bacterium]|nr:formimidoylglutamate deiminase [Actinomycetota bacterium]
MVTWHAPKAWLGGPNLDSDVLIEVIDGHIVSISSGDATKADEALSGIVLPGLVSAHSHAFHRTLRGKTHDAGGDFWAWRTRMYEVANALTPDSYRESATALFSEMVAAGITTVGEFHYVHHRPDGTPYRDPNAFGFAIIEAASTAGIRLTLLDTAYLTSNVAGAPVLPEQVRFSDGSIDAWRERAVALAEAAEGNPMVRVGVAAHSVRGVASRDLSAVAATAEELGAPLHIHVSEQNAENEATLTEHGVTPVGLLARVGLLRQTTTLVHATHLTHNDIDLIASGGSTVCFCPTTESDLGDGIGPAIELADAGVPLCLGSDSNAIVDILREAHRLEQHDRLRLTRRGVHSSEALATAATSSGGRSLGWSGVGIAPGGEADFISIDTTSNELSGTDETLGAVMSSATRSSVADVVVAGIAKRRA